MFKSLYYKFQLNFAQNTNRLIYSIINLKFLQGQISEEWYVRSDIKKIFGAFSLGKAVLWDILKKCIYFFCMIWLPLFLIMNNIKPVSYDVTFAKGMVWAFFILNGMMGSFTNSHIVSEGDEGEYLLLNLMRIDPREHYLNGILWEYGKQTIYYSLLLLFCVRGVLHGPVKLILWVMLCYVCLRPVGEAVNLRLCERCGIPFREQNKKADVLFHLYNIVMVLIAYGTYPAFYFLQGRNSSVRHPLFDSGLPGDVVLFFILAAAVAGAVVSVRYLDRYPKYLLVARRMCSLDRMQKAKETAETIKKSSLAVEDLTEEEVSNHRLFQEKSGYDYLHALFFHRHKKLVGSSVRIKVFLAGLILGVAGVALIVANLFMTQTEFMEVSNEFWGQINHILAFLVFVMYCASSGKDLTTAMFYNCDVSLLKYGYYRSREAILMSFRIRLKYMLMTEFPVVGVLCGGILVDCLLLRQYAHWGQILAILCCVCILTVFFSVIFLCMYYIFQPFTEGGKETGFGYKLCSMALWAFAYGCLQINTPPIHFAGALFGLTLFVILAAVALVRWLAPRTFHLK